MCRATKEYASRETVRCASDPQRDTGEGLPRSDPSGRTTSTASSRASGYERLPFTDAEFRAIASNVAPYMSERLSSPGGRHTTGK
jgi:hypothetical protein